MAASSNAAVKDTFFHPEHLLMKRQSQVQGGLAFYYCDACGLLGTGTRYRCDQCDFDIHEACLTGLPRFISMGQIGGQDDILAPLTRLDASRRCDACNDTSPGGRYMYRFALPAGSGEEEVYLHMHPRCVLLLTPGNQEFFHPQHLLSLYFYAGDAPTATSYYPCAVCERVCTGFQLRCSKCDFNIHSGCLSLPRSISYAMHSSEHELTLTRLTASRWCDVCKETSNAGSYMYLCVPCNYDVHPRCVASLATLVDDGTPPLQRLVDDDGAKPQQHQAELNRPAGGAGSRHGRAHAVLSGIHAVGEVADTVDSVVTVVDTVNTLASAASACTIM